MNVKEAYELITNKIKKLKAVQCWEYDSVFVFKMLPNDFDETKSVDKVLNYISSVNKKTGEIRDFKPFHIPIAEYKSGKEIKNFK